MDNHQEGYTLDDWDATTDRCRFQKERNVALEMGIWIFHGEAFALATEGKIYQVSSKHDEE